MDSIDMTDNAKERIQISKCISDTINQQSGNFDHTWNVFTFKSDKDSIDPKQFRVAKTKTSIIGATYPTKVVMDIIFNESNKVINIVFQTDINLDRTDEVDLSNGCLTKSYKKRNWSIVFSEKKGMLGKFLRK